MAYIADINSQMSNIPLVFEGRVVSVDVFVGDKNGNPLPSGSLSYNGDIGYWYLPNGDRGFGYSLATIKVCKIYKGEIELDDNHCFQVLTRSHALTNIFMDKSDATDIHKEFTYHPATHLEAHEEEVILPHTSYPTKLYLCDKLDPIGSINYSADQYYVSNFHVKYDAPMYVPVEVMGTNGIATMQTAFCQLFAQNVFKYQNEFQTFLAAIGLNPTPASYCDWDTKDDKPAPTIEEVPQRNYADNLKNYQAILDRFEIVKQNTKANKGSGHKKSSSTNDLQVDIVNERIVQIGANPWFEFDINLSSNVSGLYLDNMVGRVSYNTAAFGSSVVTNNNIVVTAGSIWVQPTYSDPNTVVNDFTGNVINVPLSSDQSQASWNRIAVPLSPIKALTVRIKIQSCNIPANITFTDVAFTPFLCWYTNNPNVSPTSTAVLTYDNTNYSGNITDPTCKPIITNWTDGVPGGIRRVASVKGKYFGNNKGIGTVIFRNADQGSPYPLQQGPNWGGLQAYDIISWTDNEIKFRMPSYIDSAWVMSGGTPVMVSDGLTPGTGKFLVKNFTGNYTQSSGPIYIPWCIYNHRYYNAPTYAKFTVRLASPTGSGGYKIQNDPALTALDPDEKAVFNRAMHDWRCPTEINWYWGPDTTMTVSNTDLKNQITLNPSLSSVARTRLLTSVCSPDANGVRKAFLDAFDMEFRHTGTAGPWQIDTTSFLVAGYTDFYHAAAHELGHAHLVNHISDSTSNLMWFRTYVYGTNFPNRFHVWYSFDAEYAGEYVTDSLVGGLQCVPNHITVGSQNCEGYDPVGIKNQMIKFDKITVYPNPSATHEDINIRFDFDKPENVRLTLYSITGGLVQYTNPEKIHKEDIIFRTADLDPGLYMLQIEVNGKKQAFKIIKE